MVKEQGMMSRHRLLQPPGRDDLPDGSGHSRAGDSLPERSGAGPVLVGGRCHGHERTEDPRAGERRSASEWTLLHPSEAAHRTV